MPLVILERPEVLFADPAYPHGFTLYFQLELTDFVGVSEHSPT